MAPGTKAGGRQGCSGCLAHTHTYPQRICSGLPVSPTRGGPWCRWGRSSQGAEKQASPNPHSHRGRHLASQGRGVFVESHRGSPSFRLSPAFEDREKPPRPDFTLSELTETERDAYILVPPCWNPWFLGVTPICRPVSYWRGLKTVCSTCKSLSMGVCVFYNIKGKLFY